MLGNAKAKQWVEGRKKQGLLSPELVEGSKGPANKIKSLMTAFRRAQRPANTEAPEPAEGPVYDWIWFHAASLGEFEQGRPVIEALKKDARDFYAEREKMLEEIHVDMREVERVMLLRSVDSRWMDHIDAMDQLRDGIGFRAYSGKNPVTEYQIEATHMFEELNHLIREDTVRRVYQTKVQVTPERVQTAKPTEARLAGDGPRQPRRVKPSQKVGRNDPCPCGSGKKYKNCCMLKEEQ